jgi:CO/xanthine dehydrogenase Mo-binding subunit
LGRIAGSILEPGQGVLGTSTSRSDGLAKVTGGARWTGDVSLPGLMHAAILRSPYPHALIRHIDARRAAALPGVVVLTRDHLEGIDPYYGITIIDQPIVALDRVRYAGDVVAAVAANDIELAREAIELIDVEYEPLDAVTDPVAAVLPTAPVIHPQDRVKPSLFVGGSADTFRTSQNVCAGYRVSTGDTQAALRGAAEVMEETYVVPSITHGYLEPNTAVASWSGDDLTVWTSTQSPSAVRIQLAEMFGLPHSRVRVIVPFVGGAFGGKSYAKIEPLVAALARRAKRPVRLALSREEVFLTLARHGAVVTITSGFTADGLILARNVDVIYDTGAYADSGPRTCKKGGYLAGGPYRIPNQALTARAVYTNKVPAGAYRGFGLPQVCWAYESHMDAIALRIGRDPVEVRRRNLLRDGDTFVTGEHLVSVGLGACLQAVAERMVPAPAPTLTPAGSAASPWLSRGVGVAVSMKSMTTPTSSVATVTLNSDGSVQVSTSSVELGQGVQTVLAQIAAEALAVRPELVAVTFPDTDVTPFDQATISSRTTFMMGNAVLGAARKVREELLDLAADHLEVATADLELHDGAVFPRGLPTMRTRYGDVLARRFGGRSGALAASHTYASAGGIEVSSGRALGQATECWMYAAVGAEVEVDRQTGSIRILRITTAVDAGRALNPTQCDLQNEGSMLVGLGSALFEELVYDNGQLMNGTFLDYRMPSLGDHPVTFESILVEVPHPSGPFGAKGVGESAISAIAPAIANAIAAATGLRIRTLPIRPESLVRQLLDPEEE